MEQKLKERIELLKRLISEYDKELESRNDDFIEGCAHRVNNELRFLKSLVKEDE